MFETKAQYYLWGIWIFWGGSLVAFLLSRPVSMVISLGGMGILILLHLFSYPRVNMVIIKMFNFNKKDDALAGVTSVSVPASVAAADNVQHELPSESNTIKETTISPGTVLRGEIINENNITISGDVDGDVTSKKVTQIGKEGKVTGKVTSAKLVVNGLLRGCCYAKTVVIMSRGRIEGDVYANEFSIEKGGVFIGNSHWVEEIPELKEKKDKTRPADNDSRARTPALASVIEDSAKPHPPQKKN